MEMIVLSQIFLKTADRPPAEAKGVVKQRVPIAPRNRMLRRKVKESEKDLDPLLLSHLQLTMRLSKPAGGLHLRAEESPQLAAAS